MLAELGYLPLNFTAASPLTSPTQEGSAQIGTFTWRWANQPASLTSLWTPGTYNVITKGAVMNFEAQHNLKTDGIAGPAVWGAVLTAVENGQGNALPYDYVYVSQVAARDHDRLPERRRRLPHRGQHRCGRSTHRRTARSPSTPATR